MGITFGGATQATIQEYVVENVKVNVSPLETPNGTIDTFTTPDEYVPGTLDVISGNINQTPNHDFYELLPNQFKFVTLKIPGVGEIVRVGYVKKLQ